MLPFFVFIFCLVVVLGAYIFATHGSEKRRARLQQRLAEALLHTAHSGDAEIQLARQELMSEIPLLNRVMLELQFAARLKRVIDQADLHITVTRLIMFSAMAGILGGLAVSMLTPMWPLAVLGGLVAASLPFLHVFPTRSI
jgi:tight adherence protein B